MDNNVFDRVFSLESLRTSFNQCKIGTSWKESVIDFDLYSDYLLRDIRDQAYEGTLKFDPMYHTIIFERGKERLICSLTIHDRVIQKSLNQNYILPLMRPKLIYDNCASLKDRGMDFAMNRLFFHLQHSYDKWGKEFYIMKLDLTSYFDSIPHNYIYSILDRYTEDKRLMYYIGQILLGYLKDPFIHNGENVPFGIGLGGEVPQSFGIICLNELDHIFKEYYRIPYIVRYMDDIILIHPDKEYLQFIFEQTKNYLTVLNMKLNEKKSYIVKATEGIKFLKFHFYLGDSYREVFILPDQKNIKREKKKICKLVDLFRNNYILDIKDIIQSYNSWRGHIQRCDSYELLNSMDQILEYTLPSEEEMEHIFVNRFIKSHGNGIHIKMKATNNTINYNLDKHSIIDKNK